MVLPVEAQAKRELHGRIIEKLGDLIFTPGFPNNAEVTDVNPNRYPKHGDPRKGQVWGGECNRTACKSLEAIMWNMGTYGLYCTSCGYGGSAHMQYPLYRMVEEKPKLECHEVFKQENNYDKCF